MCTTKSVAVSALFLICLSWARANQTQTAKSPVLELRPFTNENGSAEIWIQRATIQEWKNSLDDFLKPYRNPNVSTVYKCGDDQPPEDAICEVDVRRFGNCAPELNYGYDRGSPCIFLRLNNIPKGWIPETYNRNYSNVPDDMPGFLKNILYDERQREKVWVSCDGNYPADKEFIGPVKYYPEPAFPANYFHAADKKNFLSPLVAVQFERARFGVVINIWCTAWAVNIPRGTTDKLGTVNFDLILDY